MATVHLLRFGETDRDVSIDASTPQASATWEVHDLTTTRGSSGYVLASGAATVDTLARSPSAAAGPGTANPRRVAFDDTTGIEVGRPYLLEEDGRSELVEVAGLSADAYIDLRHPLVGTYSEAAVLQGLRLTAALPDSIAATQRFVDFEEPLRIVWTFADGSRWQQQLRVVREDNSDYDKPAVVAKVRTLFPNIHAALPRDVADPLGDLVDAMHQMVRADTLADGEAPEQLLHGDQGQWVLVWAALHHLAMQGVAPGSENTDLDRWTRHCEQQLARYTGKTRIGLAGHRTAHIDRTSGSSPTADPTARAPFRFY